MSHDPLKFQHINTRIFLFFLLLLLATSCKDSQKEIYIPDQSGLPICCSADYLVRLAEVGTYISGDNSIEGGNIENGKQIYLDKCQDCHGESGEITDSNADDSPTRLGQIAVDDPRRFFEVTNFNFRDMPGYYNDLSLQELIDVMAFAQTLPEQ